jgi:hypothetical protein
VNQSKLPERLRARLVGAARGSSSHPVLRTAHRAVVGFEIAAATVWASRNRVSAVDPGNTTLVIKTFERPQALRRMLASVRRVFAGPIIIADDSQTPYSSDDPLVTVLRLPFDSGVGAGRNALIDAVDTEYLWMADDDMILLPDFDLQRVIDYLDRNQQVDLCGGRVVNLPQARAISYLNSDLFAYQGQPVALLGTLVDGLPVAYKVPNWYVARTEQLRQVRYDDRLKRVDHTDFFSTAYGRLLCVVDEQMTCLHSHSYFDPHYLAFRQDTAADMAYLAGKWRTTNQKVGSAELDLDPLQRATLHHAAVQVVADDLGISIVHQAAGDAAAVLAAPGDQPRLSDALLRLGWQGAGNRLTNPLWGGVEVRQATDQLVSAAERVAVAGVTGLATRPNDWPAPPASSTAPPSGWISWGDRVGWLEGGDAIIAAPLPLGPVYTLTTPGDLIWASIGPRGGQVTTIIADVKAEFSELPDGVDQQITDYLELLISRGLLQRH